MKKPFYILLAGLACIASVSAQVTVKKDISKDYSLLPPMPASLKQAHDASRCKTGACNADSLIQPLKQSVDGDAKAIGTLSTQESSDVKTGTAMAQKMQSDGVQNMNDNQKLDYVKNNPQLNNGNANAVAFAQKMKNDPAEKARLQAMTPQQKMAYLQQNGMLNMNVPQTNAPASSSNNSVSDALDKQTQMQDSETTPVIRNLSILLENQINGNSIDSAHAVIDKQMNKELDALPKQNLGESYGASRASVLAVEKKYMQKHIDLATKQMLEMEKTFNSLCAYYLKYETPFCNSLATAGYGYNTDGTQDPSITKLASGQAIMLNNVQKMTNYSKSIYEFAANWWEKNLRLQNEK